METYESRINVLSLEELDNLDSDIFDVVIEKLFEIKHKSTDYQRHLVIDFAQRLASLDIGKIKKFTGVHYSTRDRMFVACKVVNKRKITIHRSTNQDECIEKYKEFVAKTVAI